MRTLYFDSSAFGELWRSRRFGGRDLLRIRRRLASSMWEGRPRLVIGNPLLSEMAQHGDAALRDEQLALLRTLRDVEFLKTSSERVRAEVAAAQAGSTPDVMLDDHERRKLWEVLDSRAVWVDARKALAEDKDAFLEAERVGRAGILARVGGQKALAAGLQRWFTDRDRLVGEWATDLMRAQRKKFGLGPDERAWPDPKKLRTVWASTAFKLARLYLVNRDGRRLDANDLPDRQHYMAAAYADCLVVEDSKFRAVAAECPAPKPEVISFTDWATEVLA